MSEPSMSLKEFTDLLNKAAKAARVITEVAKKVKPLGYELEWRNGELVIRNINEDEA